MTLNDLGIVAVAKKYGLSKRALMVYFGLTENELVSLLNFANEYSSVIDMFTGMIDNVWLEGDEVLHEELVQDMYRRVNKRLANKDLTIIEADRLKKDIADTSCYMDALNLVDKLDWFDLLESKAPNHETQDGL